ncbi:MAG: GumC family protein [Anaerolineaceae bacterium]
MNATQEQTGGLSLRDILIIIFSKLHVMIVIFLTILIVTLAVAFFTDPIYKVTANVLVKPALESSLKLQAPTPTHLSANPVTVQDINSEVNILSSPMLLRQLVQKLELAREEQPKGYLSRLWSYISDLTWKLMLKIGLVTEINPEDNAVLELQKRLEIKPITLSNMIEVSMAGKDPALITRTVNELLGDYIVYHTNLFRAKGAREFYALQAETFAKSLRKAEDDLENFKKEWSVVEIAAQNNANISLMRILQENLALLKAQISERQVKTTTQQKNLAKTGDIGAFTKEFQTPILEELVRTMGPLLAERERIRLLFEESTPKYLALDKQIHELKQAYDKQVKEILGGSQLDLEGLINNAGAIESIIDSTEKQSVLLSQKQVELDRLTREVKQNEENYLLYLRKTEEARMEEQQDTSRVSNVAVTRWADTPSIPIFPRKILMTFLALVLGVLMGVAGTFITYYVDHTVKTPLDIARHCRIPVLTSVSLITDDRQKRGTTRSAEPKGPTLWMSEPQSFPAIQESFRTLKTSICPANPFLAGKLLMVTGSDNRAGTSTAAFNLALVLAWDFLDQRILLVDTNMATPSLHEVFGKEMQPGLMNYLTEDQPLQQIVQPSMQPNLDLVTVGRGSPDILSPFDLQKFNAFLDEVRQQYAFVVLDSAPVLRSSDTRIISAKVDGTVVVVEAGRSRYEVINETKYQLIGKAPLVGCVLNKRRFSIPRLLYSRI